MIGRSPSTGFGGTKTSEGSGFSLGLGEGAGGTTGSGLRALPGSALGSGARALVVETIPEAAAAAGKVVICGNRAEGVSFGGGEDSDWAGVSTIATDCCFGFGSDDTGKVGAGLEAPVV